MFEVIRKLKKNKTIDMSKKRNLMIILLFALMFLLPLISMKANTFDSNNYDCEFDNVEVTANSTEVSKAFIRQELNREVRTYVMSVHKNCSDIIPTYIVTAGLENNIDICFMLAQTQLETTFGNAGIGRASSKKSLFGVEKRVYKTYPEAIDDYIRILKKSYLVKGRTEQYLMKNYVNKAGYRYAGNPNYEVHLRRYYNTIVMKTKIKELQDQYRRLL